MSITGLHRAHIRGTVRGPTGIDPARRHDSARTPTMNVLTNDPLDVGEGLIPLPEDLTVGESQWDEAVSHYLPVPATI